ncbi:MAG: MFS transporter, partial [Planctomycetota bacterium]
MSDNSIPQKKIFIASFVTLIAAGVGFAVRGGILGQWSSLYGFTQTDLGTITGGGLVGFGAVILFASLITDNIGYKKILVIAFILHALSAAVTLAAGPVYAAMGTGATYWVLYIGMFMFAVANGLCEAVINPLTANLYPEKKTHYLNILHAGWPGGLILGGLIISAMGSMHWTIPMGLFLIPTVIYGFMVITSNFPDSDVKKAGISFDVMLKSALSPVFLFLLVLHACIGYVELGTDSWIQSITNTISEGQGPMLFIYASAIMFILRFFAGPIVEKINPLGLLTVSSILGCVGLLLLGTVESAALVWVSVTVYGLGKTFLWPTMLGVVGERFPKGGALTMGLIGGVGMLSAGFLGTPGIGYKQDYFASQKLEELSKDAVTRYQSAEEKGINGLPFIAKIRGLDGSKVGLLLDSDPENEANKARETLEADVKTIQQKQADKVEIGKGEEGTLALSKWWA